MGGLLGQIIKILIQDPAHTVHGAVDQLDTAEFAGFQNRSNHGLVDNRCRTTSLGDQYLAVKHKHALLH
jgi:hypothetical protein